mgnify:CR=1 FL=1
MNKQKVIKENLDLSVFIVIDDESYDLNHNNNKEKGGKYNDK